MLEQVAILMNLCGIRQSERDSTLKDILSEHSGFVHLFTRACELVERNFDEGCSTLHRRADAHSPSPVRFKHQRCC